MSLEQVSLDIMNVNFSTSTPAEEKDTLPQVVDMLDKKIETIRQNGRVVSTDKIAIMAILNVIHDLLKMSIKDSLVIGELKRKIVDMANACDKVLSRLEWSISLFPYGVREGIHSFGPISSFEVTGSNSGRERLS